MKNLRFNVVLPAAGIGARVGADIPKQYLKLKGKTIIEHTIDALVSHPHIGKVIVVLSTEDTYFAALTSAYGDAVETTTGGKQRVDSVLAGLLHLASQAADHPLSCTPSQWVLVHDAARPCVTHAEIDSLLAAYLKTDGAILALPCSDTLKMTDVDGQSTNVVQRTLDRSLIWQAQTPQFFPLFSLINAIRLAPNKDIITDEASAIEGAGGQVTLVEGLSSNIKITRQSDLALAEYYLANNIRRQLC